MQRNESERWTRSIGNTYPHIAPAQHIPQFRSVDFGGDPGYWHPSNTTGYNQTTNSSLFGTSPNSSNRFNPFASDSRTARKKEQPESFSKPHSLGGSITKSSSSNVQKEEPSCKSKDQEKIDSKSATKQCVVCLERDVRRICLPCGHPCLCEICSTEQGLRKLKHKCPECRANIRQVATIYGRVVDD